MRPNNRILVGSGLRVFGTGCRGCGYTHRERCADSVTWLQRWQQAQTSVLNGRVMALRDRFHACVLLAQAVENVERCVKTDCGMSKQFCKDILSKFGCFE